MACFEAHIRVKSALVYKDRPAERLALAQTLALVNPDTDAGLTLTLTLSRLELHLNTKGINKVWYGTRGK